ncbi:MAG: nucleotidyltransferase domain-containing protein [Wenzhouxiangella sp.]|nr:MAG: nucleotidyltransferase domain-containing protein [Wenzhouxiangella sp.]
MDPTASILFGKTRQAVLGALYQCGEPGIYIRELQRQSGISSGALHHELRQLMKADLVSRRVDGNRVLYSINREHPVAEPLREIVLKTCGLPAQIRLALAPIENRLKFAAIFGSIAAGSAHAASDIDLILVGDVSHAEVIDLIQPLEAELGREIGFRLYEPASFRARAETDAFLIKVLERPTIELIGKFHDA